jgi:hypothetical protein
LDGGKRDQEKCATVFRPVARKLENKSGAQRPGLRNAISVAIIANIQFLKSDGIKNFALRGFGNQQRLLRQPTAITQTFQRGRDQVFVIRRIEKDQIERTARSRAQRPQIGGVAPPDLGRAGQSQGFDILPL